MRKKWLLLGTTLLLTFGIVACDSSNSGDVTNGSDGTNTTEQEDNLLSNNSKDTDADDTEADSDANADTDETDDVNEDIFEPVEVTAGGWEVIIENTMRDDSLENVNVVLGYTDATTSEFRQEASEGYEYFLIKLAITKADSMEKISWDNMTLLDENGNTYKRIEDTFIDELGMIRMPGTDLNFGTNEGWIAFEVKEESKGLTLKYEFENENFEYTFEDH